MRGFHTSFGDALKWPGTRSEVAILTSRHYSIEVGSGWLGIELLDGQLVQRCMGFKMVIHHAFIGGLETEQGMRYEGLAFPRMGRDAHDGLHRLLQLAIHGNHGCRER